MESAFAMLTGIAIGFYYEWKIACVCLVAGPILGVVAAVNTKFRTGLGEENDKNIKDAQVLAGDAILNYRQVASFGHEEQIIRDYEKLLEGPKRKAMAKSHIMGLTYGASQFMQYAMFATLFYFGAYFSVKWPDNTKPEDVFIAI